MQNSDFKQGRELKQARRFMRRKQKRNEELQKLRGLVATATDLIIQSFAKDWGVSYPQALNRIAEITPQLFDDPAMWPGLDAEQETQKLTAKAVDFVIQMFADHWGVSYGASVTRCAQLQPQLFDFA